jgi:hypothetical protein
MEFVQVECIWASAWRVALCKRVAMVAFRVLDMLWVLDKGLEFDHPSILKQGEV